MLGARSQERSPIPSIRKGLCLRNYGDDQREQVMDIAVIGSGISGLAAAWALSADHHVTLYESGDRLGGHSRTIDAVVHGVELSVDTGFIVYNERNYPNLTAFFDTLGVETLDSDMSFAVDDRETGLEYAGRVGALFPTIRSFADRRHWAILRGLAQFRAEVSAVENGDVGDHETIGSYLRRRGYPSDFVSGYLVPLAAAVWSGSRDVALEMPARTFLEFLDNHGLLALSDRPQWRTVAGGARSYVDRVAKEITVTHTGAPVRSVERLGAGVRVVSALGTVDYDHVVLATHADVTLKILGDEATADERRILGAFGYSDNEVVLHTDRAAMPGNERVWSSWNVAGTNAPHHPVGVTYWMNRLQSIDGPDVFVTLNPGNLVAERAVLDRWHAAHPQFTPKTRAAQRSVRRIQHSGGISYAGAYLGHGFHEDGARSGFEVAAALGSPPPWSSDPERFGRVR